MPQPPIFISYAHDTAREAAKKLRDELGDLAFLDEANILTRAEFTRTITDALMESRVAVIFADKRHDERPFCRWERAMILAPKTHDHVFIMEPGGEHKFYLDPYPVDLKNRNWNATAADVRYALESGKRLPLRELIGPGWRFLLAEQMEKTEVPAPKIAKLASLPTYGFAKAGSLNERFVGRADALADLNGKLLGHYGATVALTAALTAAGGFGKTRLALEYVYRFAPEHYSGGIFWVNCEDQVETQFWKMLIILNGTPEREISTVKFDTIPDLLAERVAQQVASGLPVLFVLDNVPEGEAGGDLTRFCPALGLVSVIVTTRQRNLSAADGTIEVGMLDEIAASLVLTRNVPERTKLIYAEWDEITEWVGRLPLALELLNAALRNQVIRMPELLAHARSREFTEAGDAFASVPGMPREVARGISQTFAISYGALTPAAEHAAQCLAQFGPEPIPSALLAAFGEEVDAPEIRLQLIQHSWVTAEPDADGVEQFGSIHRVLASYLRSKGNEAERAVDAAERVFEDGPNWQNPKDWPLLNRVRPHAEALMARCGDTAWVALGVWLGNLASAQGDLAGARAINERALAIRRRVLGEEHPDTLTSMSNLAETMWAQGDLAGARAFGEQVLATRRRVLGEEHPHTLTSMGNLALTINAQGDLAAALEIEEQALAIRLRVLGEEHPDTLTSMANLGATMKAQGDLDGARANEEQVLAISRRVLGEEHPDTLTSMSNLASTMKAQGDLAGARAINQQVLAIRHRVLGEEHPDTLTSMNNLASTMKAQGDLAGARAINQQVLAIRRRVLGEEHPDTLTSMNNLASTMKAQGDLGSARTIHEQVQEIRRRVLGEEHPATLVSAWNLLMTLEQLPDAASAADAAGAVFRAHLQPMLEREPASLPADLRNLLPAIRERVTLYSGKGAAGD